MTVRILKGDCREILRGLPEESVHCDAAMAERRIKTDAGMFADCVSNHL